MPLLLSSPILTALLLIFSTLLTPSSSTTFPNCHRNFTCVTVPVIGDAAGRLTGSEATLAETLMEGFNVNYSNQYATQCSNCTYFGNQCGFDSNSSQPICICDGDLPCHVPIVLLGSSSTNRFNLGIKLTIAFSIIVAVTWLITIIFCLKRRFTSSANAVAFWKKECVDDQIVEAFIRNYRSLAPKR
ncbi:hypothetical protein LOK49_LG01G03497 [Camellia lanceoleosa]|uniref:Uncharacterized protein n=1 Tax=Camellia lanceoleosa TaxID=1840588 RepID=A0ACC0J2Y9_9ERIC|nr:hypothetical protein LOK49_LG01G03497 [Camellia lanceoleosa]